MWKKKGINIFEYQLVLEIFVYLFFNSVYQIQGIEVC